MLADIPEKLEVADAPHPVGVVDDVHAVARRGEHRADLPLDAGDVGGQFIGREEVPLLAAATRVADHAGRPADEGDGLVAGPGHATQEQQGHEVADVEAVGRGIKARVDPAARCGEPLPQRGRIGRLMDEAAGLELGEEVVSHVVTARGRRRRRDGPARRASGPAAP